VRSSHQFEEEIGAATSENGLFIAKMEFSIRTAHPVARQVLRTVLNSGAERVIWLSRPNELKSPSEPLLIRSGEKKWRLGEIFDAILDLQ